MAMACGVNVMKDDDLYSWRLALYWLHHDPFGIYGYNVIRNGWLFYSDFGEWA